MVVANTGSAVSETKPRNVTLTSSSSVTSTLLRWVGTLIPQILACPKKSRRVCGERSKKDVFAPAALIVEDVLKEIITANDVNLPKPANLVRIAKRCRQHLRPRDPTDLDFEVKVIIIIILKILLNVDEAIQNGFNGLTLGYFPAIKTNGANRNVGLNWEYNYGFWVLTDIPDQDS
ncbi:hypothetical protein DPMN_169061 [Dreissena polymorpha]|uniref:Uncharacterized protein n=1 Tax=Dreissena polymorpha TaxID=45954 RepID=A0A9D4F327_DREPO|nr:hypothetical protein DPMN_169061 [Dreissena polymorpha]